MRAFLFLEEYDEEKKVYRFHYIIEGTNIRFAVEFKKFPTEEERRKKATEILKEIEKTMKKEETKGEVIET
ncbi:MAG: hypothetical protein JTT12_05515 [Candidatus Brockarchaeota archaeon]|nr:hypothetical protein [Candidatus Brockarchaeota archaeon]